MCVGVRVQVRVLHAALRHWPHAEARTRVQQLLEERHTRPTVPPVYSDPHIHHSRYHTQSFGSERDMRGQGRAGSPQQHEDMLWSPPLPYQTMNTHVK